MNIKLAKVKLQKQYFFYADSGIAALLCRLANSHPMFVNP